MVNFAIDIVDDHIDFFVLNLLDIDERVALKNVLQSWRTFIGEPMQILFDQACFTDHIATCDHNSNVFDLFLSFWINRNAYRAWSIFVVLKVVSIHHSVHERLLDARS